MPDDHTDVQDFWVFACLIIVGLFGIKAFHMLDLRGLRDPRKARRPVKERDELLAGCAGVAALYVFIFGTLTLDWTWTLVAMAICIVS